MKLITFDEGFGRVQNGTVVPMGMDLVSFLQTGQKDEADPIPLSTVQILPPVPAPQKIIAVGLNYRDHATETGAPFPEEPVLFAKFANSITGPRDPIFIPAAAISQVDFEAELGVVIGQEAREVSASDALSYVYGYTCLNDVSARDLQFGNGGQWLRGKAVDAFLPMGPWVVSADEVGDPQRLGIRSLLNSELMQESSTSQMIFTVAELVSFVSQTITLSPGDVIATGTPSGVGFSRKPPRFLQPGDEITVEIERIGSITNPVLARDRLPAGGFPSPPLVELE